VALGTQTKPLFIMTFYLKAALLLLPLDSMQNSNRLKALD